MSTPGWLLMVGRTKDDPSHKIPMKTAVRQCFDIHFEKPFLDNCRVVVPAEVFPAVLEKFGDIDENDRSGRSAMDAVAAVIERDAVAVKGIGKRTA